MKKRQEEEKITFIDLSVNKSSKEIGNILLC